MNADSIFSLLKRLVDSRGTTHYTDELFELRRALETTEEAEAVLGLSRGLTASNDWMRFDALNELRILASPRALQALLPLVTDPMVHVRRETASALGAIGGAEVVAPLIRMLQDPEPEVRIFAASALRTVGDPCALTPLVHALEQETAEDASPSIAGAIAAILPPENSTVFMRLLQHKNPVVRIGAAHGLGDLRCREAVPALCETRSDPDATVRRWAIWALDRIHDPRSIPTLRQALDDESPSVRREAGFALGNLHAQDAIDALLQALDDPIENIGVSFALAALGRPVLPALLDQLTSPRELVRRNTTATLLTHFLPQHPWSAEVIRTQALTELVALLRDPNEQTQRHTVRLLGAIYATTVVDALSDLVDHPDPYLRRQLIATFGALGTPAACEMLRWMATHDQGVVESDDGDQHLGMLAQHMLETVGREPNSNS